MKSALKSVFNIAALGAGLPGMAVGAYSSFYELTTPYAEKVAMGGVDFTLPSLAILGVSAALAYAGYRGVQKSAVEKYKNQNPPAP